METKASQDLNALIAALLDGDFFARVGPGFALLTPGDWQGLQRWAASHGFAFTLHDLYAYCRAHPNILGQLSHSPQLAGWNLESLKRAAEA